MCFFRTNFPDNSFPPQLHVLEEYVIPFRSKWHFRLGFFSEQGDKSVDHEFAQLASTFFHAKPATLRLKKMMEKHHFPFHPKNSWTSNCSIQHIYEWSCLRDKTLVIVLKTEQREASELLLREKDVFCVLQTGFGKSPIYQMFVYATAYHCCYLAFQKYYGRTNSMKLIQPFCLWIAFWL